MADALWPFADEFRAWHTSRRKVPQSFFGLSNEFHEAICPLTFQGTTETLLQLFDVLPLHSDLVARLRQWFTEREGHQDDQLAVLSLNRAANVTAERLFPGTWAERAFKMLRNDLEAAGITYVTADGIADFHSLRHTFISNLAACGIHPNARAPTCSAFDDRSDNGPLHSLGADRHEFGVGVPPEHRRPRLASNPSNRHNG